MQRVILILSIFCFSNLFSQNSTALERDVQNTELEINSNYSVTNYTTDDDRYSNLIKRDIQFLKEIALLILNTQNNTERHAYLNTLIKFRPNVFAKNINLFELTNDEIGDFIEGVLRSEYRTLKLRLMENYSNFLKLKICKT